uniref:HAT C-terminal dimerisation domain-containing protein n=1 Tax=Ditylenchus dipsaci TaxID=166011 RepID=A0A915ENJ6_9BILA
MQHPDQQDDNPAGNNESESSLQCTSFSINIDRNANNNVNDVPNVQTESPLYNDDELFSNILSINSALAQPENPWQFRYISLTEFVSPHDRLPRTADIFQWYKSKLKEFLKITSIAQVLFGIPVASVHSERLFSKAGLIYGNKLRNRLSATHAEEMLIVKANLSEVLLAPPTETAKEEYAEEDVRSDEE